MCGIAGFIATGVASAERETAVSRMRAAMHHRGPDDTGQISRQEATLGSCRLAIFDPAHGHQPVSTPDGRWTIVFNGAIYNFQELKAELARAGWAFRTNCDTEVLLAAYGEWGPACLRRLRGMFAFAVWDERERSLFVARDAFGIKPLYYHQEGQRFAFASELNALLASGVVGGALDPTAVADYLGWFSVPAPRTIYRDVFSLRAGEYAVWQAEQLRVESAWSFAGIPATATTTDYPGFVRELRVRLEDSIRAHVLADVPVGAFLSGGLDSAVIVGLMSRIGGARLRTFSIAFDEGDYSEAARAEATARHFGSNHETHVLTGTEVSGDLDRILAALDHPTGDGINTYYASRIARRGGVTVALSGLGGDELFGGYPSFADTPRLARLIPWWRNVPPPLRRAIVARLNRGDTRRRKLADVLQHATTLHEVGALQRRVFSESSRHALLHPDVAAAAGLMSPFHPELHRLAPDLEQCEPFQSVSAWELRTYMADVLLRDSDVMSMRHSLELRVPFIDRPLIEWLWRQRTAAWASHRKSALFDACADLLPSDLRRRPKQGFTLPFPLWMKRELRPFLEDTFAEASINRTGLFATREVRALWEGFLVGHDSREWSRVWSLAVLINFASRRTTGPVMQPSPPATVSGADTAQPADRVLLMAPEVYQSEGGISRILQLYLRALCDRNRSTGGVSVVALNDSPERAARARQYRDGALAAVAGCSRNKLRFVARSLAAASDADTIICGHIRQLPIAWLARRLNPRLRYFLVAHGFEVWRPFTAVERIALTGAERILCVSDYTRGELVKHCPAVRDRAVVLHNALDPVFAIAAGKPLAQCAPVILVVTRITYADRYKGVPHLIEAMPAIRTAIPDARLRIVGRGDDVPRLKALAASLGVAEAVEFLGYIDDACLREELRSCRLFALPSRKEGFGLVFLEAMASGRPCLGARAGGVPEVITSETGVLVDYGDVPMIATAAITALRAGWNESAILDRARAFSYTRFSEQLAYHLTP